jgi:hypothetical protein
MLIKPASQMGSLSGRRAAGWATGRQGQPECFGASQFTNVLRTRAHEAPALRLANLNLRPRASRWRESWSSVALLLRSQIGAAPSVRCAARTCPNTAVPAPQVRGVSSSVLGGTPDNGAGEAFDAEFASVEAGLGLTARTRLRHWPR